MVKKTLRMPLITVCYATGGLTMLALAASVWTFGGIVAVRHNGIDAEHRIKRYRHD